MAQRLNSAAFKAMPVLAEDQTSAAMICWATPLPLEIENLGERFRSRTTRAPIHSAKDYIRTIKNNKNYFFHYKSLLRLQDKKGA